MSSGSDNWPKHNFKEFLGLQITILYSFTAHFIEPCCFKKSEAASSLWGQRNG